jgi:hypothetical protein
MPKFIIDLLKIDRCYTTLTIEAPNPDAAKRIALDQAEAEDEDLGWTVDEYDLTAWLAGDDVRDDSDVNRMRVGDAAYEAAGAPAKPD